MSTKASRISNTGRKWINQSATKERSMNMSAAKEQVVEIIKVTGWNGVGHERWCRAIRLVQAQGRGGKLMMTMVWCGDPTVVNVSMARLNDKSVV